jgi:hypothetical protein
VHSGLPARFSRPLSERAGIRQQRPAAELSPRDNIRVKSLPLRIVNSNFAPVGFEPASSGPTTAFLSAEPTGVITQQRADFIPIRSRHGPGAVNPAFRPAWKREIHVHAVARLLR